MKDGVAVGNSDTWPIFYSENTYGFVNNITRVEGGIHEDSEALLHKDV